MALTVPAVMVPVTPSDDNVPTEVILGWAAVDMIPIRVFPVTDPLAKIFPVTSKAWVGTVLLTPTLLFTVSNVMGNTLVAGRPT